MHICFYSQVLFRLKLVDKSKHKNWPDNEAIEFTFDADSDNAEHIAKELKENVDKINDEDLRFLVQAIKDKCLVFRLEREDRMENEEPVAATTSAVSSATAASSASAVLATPAATLTSAAVAQQPSADLTVNQQLPTQPQVVNQPMLSGAAESTADRGTSIGGAGATLTHLVNTKDPQQSTQDLAYAQTGNQMPAVATSESASQSQAQPGDYSSQVQQMPAANLGALQKNGNNATATAAGVVNNNPSNTSAIQPSHVATKSTNPQELSKEAAMYVKLANKCTLNDAHFALRQSSTLTCRVQKCI